MTVAAVVLAARPESALRDVEGAPNVRRLVDTAWAGGATPIVVVAPDPGGSVAAALAGSPAVLASPAPLEGGPLAQVCRGIDVARAEVDGTTAALVWPARMGWVDAETVTSLIEVHGATPAAVVRPTFAGTTGWPALVPITHLEVLRGLRADLDPDELLEALDELVDGRLVELGDPGAVHDLDTSRAALPPFEGPPDPPGGHRHEWGSPAAAEPDTPPAPPRTIP